MSVYQNMIYTLYFKRGYIKKDAACFYRIVPNFLADDQNQMVGMFRILTTYMIAFSFLESMVKIHNFISCWCIILFNIWALF